MADIDDKPLDANPFGQVDEVAGPKPADNDNPFGHFPDEGQAIGAPQRSAGGSFARSAARSVLPAAGGLVGAGAGAEVGAALGLLGGPFAPITVPVAGTIGGVLGFFGGSYAGEAAQHYALKSAPDGWTDALGMSDRQQRLDQAQHPTASFLGGLLPYALTMRPGGFARGALPENATTMQRIMANPVTKGLFGGGTMGGLELAQEAYHGDINWTNVAIATGFGVVWNKPTRLGERIHELGAASTRALGQAVARPFSLRGTEIGENDYAPLTIQMAGDARVIGPGVTEDVFQGTHQQDASAQMIAQQQQRDSAQVTGERPGVGADVHDVARRLSPDTFEAYDGLQQQRDTLDRWLDTYRNPSTDQLQDLAAQRDAIQAEGGFLPNRGPEARRYRARLRDIERQYQTALERRQAYMEGRLEYSDEALQVQRQRMAVDEQMRDMAGEVSAVTRRARDAIAAGQVLEAPRPADVPAAAPPAPPEPAPVDLAQGRAAIVAHAFRKWVAAGRTPDEARAAAEIEADRFVTRARRFKGALGTASELYGREGAVVQGAGGRPAPPFTPPPGAAAASVPPVARAGAPPAPAAPVAAEAPAAAPAAAPARPKAFPDWEVGKEVAVGPYKQLEVVEVRPDSFVLRSPRGQLWEFTPPAKAPKDENSLEWLAHLQEIQQPRPDVEPGEAGVPIPTEQELAQSAKGRIRVRGAGQSIITLMKDADASTVIHELWHDFFEQLMRDAEHPQAPPSVRDDAQAIYDALKVNSREEVKTRHHEQVARWGEQYLREGRAPSAGLASVFEQFKTWLTGIYQTIKGLGRSINDDVRGVFDRMLAEEPHAPVIAPDRASAPTLADVQRRDAQETEPAQAEPVMDRVVAETQQAEQRLAPEVKDEVQAVFDEVAKAVNPPGETGGGAEPAGDLGASGGASGPEPGGGGGGEGAGGVVGGRGAARPEGPSVPAGESGQGPRAASEPPLSPTPAAQFGARESGWEDKAGNIRLDNLTDMESVQQMLREVSEANEDFIGDRRGVVTDQQIDDVAAAAGMQGAERLAAVRIRGQAFNAGEIMTLRKALLQSAGEVNAAMQRVAEASSSDQDVLWYAMVRDRHQLLQATVSQATAEAGRALRAFRTINEAEAGGTDEFVRQATGRTLFQLREEAKLGAKLDTPEKVSKFLNDAKKPGFGRMILEYWINNLISGPATHTTYTIGNMMLAINKMGPETAAAALIGRARGRGAEGVQMGEIGAQFRGAARGFVPAVHASVESLRSGLTTLLPGETGRVAMPFQPGVTGAVGAPVLNEAAKFGDVKASLFGALRGMRDAFVATDSLIPTGDPRGLPLIGTEYSALGAIPDIRIGGAVVPVGTAQRLPSRMVASIHSFFRAMNYSIEKSAQAYRTASGEGLTGDKLDARTGELWQNPTPAIMEQARTEATQLTMMGQGSKFTQALSRLTNTDIFGFPLLKFIDPFVHISSNVIDQSLIRRTPVGFLSPELRADLMGRNGAIAQDKAQARMLVGTAFAMTVGGLAAQGLVSGSGPTEPREAAMWRLAGNQAHSVRIGDFWYDTHRLGPMGMLMGVAADMYEVVHVANEGEFTTAGAHLLHAITQNVLDESFMRGPSDLIKAVEESGRYGEGYIRNFLSSFVPFSVGLSQEARAVDPYSREARSVVDAMRAKVPGLSMDLLPRIDIWGQPMPNRQAVLSSGLTALYMQHVSTDPVNLVMVELGIHPAPVDRKIRNVELTDQQHLAFAQNAGRMSKMRLDTIVQSPDWQSWNPETRRHVITEVIRQSREVARAQVMAQDPTILQRATAAKLDKLRK